MLLATLLSLQPLCIPQLELMPKLVLVTSLLVDVVVVVVVASKFE